MTRYRLVRNAGLWSFESLVREMSVTVRARRGVASLLSEYLLDNQVRRWMYGEGICLSNAESNEFPGVVLCSQA